MQRGHDVAEVFHVCCQLRSTLQQKPPQLQATAQIANA
jgi:hypothetical protein